MNEEMVIRNEKLIYFALQSMKLYNNREDYYDVGMIGLVKGVQTYDPSCNISESTYLLKCVKNEILSEVRKEQSFKRKANKNAVSIYNKCEENIEFINMIPSNEDIEANYIKSVEIENLREGLKKLNKNERLVLYYNFGLYGCERLTQRQIADKLGMSQGQVSRIKTKSIEKLKAKLNGE